VLGLRYFVCNGCETVYADVERPLPCDVCDDESIEQIGPETQAVNYFIGR